MESLKSALLIIALLYAPVMLIIGVRLIVAITQFVWRRLFFEASARCGGLISSPKSASRNLRFPGSPPSYTSGSPQTGDEWIPHATL